MPDPFANAVARVHLAEAEVAFLQARNLPTTSTPGTDVIVLNKNSAVTFGSGFYKMYIFSAPAIGTNESFALLTFSDPETESANTSTVSMVLYEKEPSGGIRIVNTLIQAVSPTVLGEDVDLDVFVNPFTGALLFSYINESFTSGESYYVFPGTWNDNYTELTVAIPDEDSPSLLIENPSIGTDSDNEQILYLSEEYGVYLIVEDSGLTAQLINFTSSTFVGESHTLITPGDGSISVNIYQSIIGPNTLMIQIALSNLEGDLSGNQMIAFSPSADGSQLVITEISGEFLPTSIDGVGVGGWNLAAQGFSFEDGNLNAYGFAYSGATVEGYVSPISSLHTRSFSLTAEDGGSVFSYSDDIVFESFTSGGVTVSPQGYAGYPTTFNTTPYPYDSGPLGLVGFLTYDSDNSQLLALTYNAYELTDFTHPTVADSFPSVYVESSPDEFPPESFANGTPILNLTGSSFDGSIYQTLVAWYLPSGTLVVANITDEGLVVWAGAEAVVLGSSVTSILPRTTVPAVNNFLQTRVLNAQVHMLEAEVALLQARSQSTFGN